MTQEMCVGYNFNQYMNTRGNKKSYQALSMYQLTGCKPK